jgi:hypothetical protein
MDYSQYIRLKQEATNSYVARNKTVDSSLLTMVNMQRATYAGDATLNTPAYYRGAPIVNPIYPDISANPLTRSYTQGHGSLRLSQQEGIANKMAGAAVVGDSIYGDPKYGSVSPGIQIKSLAEMMTIIRHLPAQNNAFVPSVDDKQVEFIRYEFYKSLPSMVFNGNSFLKSSLDTVYNSSGSTDFTIEFFIQPSSNRTASITKTFSATWSNNATTIAKTGGTTPAVGDILLATGIPNGTTVTNVNVNTITISKNTTTTASSATTVDVLSNTQTVFYIGEAAVADTYKLVGSLVTTSANTVYKFRLKVSTFSAVEFGEFTAGKWYHVAIMRYGTKIYFFQNGVIAGNITVGVNIPDANNPNGPNTVTYLSGDSSLTFIGGTYTDSNSTFANGFTGYITNFRWTKGYVQYLDRSNFTEKMPDVFAVPTLPLFITNPTYILNYLTPYVSVGLLAESASTVKTNTRSPTATVSIQDGNAISPSYDLVTWAIA